jgi:energy-coupling factor transport system ATP-binding protein
VRRLDLVIEPGERVLLLGASGAGKSTLLQGVAGVLGDENDGQVEGTLTAASSGLVLQDPDSQVILARVGDDVAFGCENLGVEREEIWRRVADALDAVGLDLPLDHPTSGLSGGQKQRLALAGVLAMRPDLLLLDEPTANLDPDGVREVRDAVARVLDAQDRTARDRTLVVVEHRVDVWWPLVDRVVVLEPGGGVVADGPPDRVLAREGARLAASGIWVPGFEPVAPGRRHHPGSELLRAEALAVGRTEPLATGLDLSIRARECLGVTGPNGAGKSTLALTLGGLIRPLGGGLAPDPLRWTSRELVTRIGSVFQDPEHQFVAATVLAELRVGAKAVGLGQRETSDRIDALLARLRLDSLADVNPFTLSGGEKRRLSVATALVTRPPLLILDEPTFGQDARTWAELVAFLAELLDEGSAVVAVTHDTALVGALADRELRMSAAVPA